jgi:cell division transport system permease protein
LDKTDLRHTAVVDGRFRGDVGAATPSAAYALIELTEYRPNYLKYTTSSAAEGLAVFSEIYYDKGWTAYIDGAPAPYLRADYILRAMTIPAGDHTVEWRFRAPGFAAVEGVTLASSILILLCLFAAALSTFNFQQNVMAQEDKRLRRRVRNSQFVATVSIAMVLFLVGSTTWLIMGALRATDRLRQSVVIHVMLAPGLTADQTSAMSAALASDEAVRQVVFVPRAEAARRFIAESGEDFTDFLGDDPDDNPLPDSFEVGLSARGSDREVIGAFVDRAGAMAGVDEVVYQRGVVEQIGTNLGKFNLVVLLFGGALLVVSLILLRNTIRMTISARQRIINTMKLVGATPGFIMRPFLARALWHGFLAGVIGSALFLLLVVGLNEGIPEVDLGADNRLLGAIIGGMIAGGMVVSLLFTIFAVRGAVRRQTAVEN